MPSPFPGMDPYLESDEWESFHVQFVVLLSHALAPKIRPRYVVRAERRVYLEHVPGADEEPRRPDVAVLRARRAPRGRTRTESREGTVSPVLVTLPMPEGQEETFLTIKLRETREVITIVELLSPANKRTGSDGRQEYLKKREEALCSRTHLVELDLLRGGARLPTRDPIPPGDYYAFVCRGDQRPRAEVFAWSLRDRLPGIPIPLAEGDPDVWVDLQSTFDAVFDASGYDYSLDRSRALRPPLAAADARWAKRVLSRR